MSTAPKRTITIDTNLQGIIKRGKNKSRTNNTIVKPKLKPNQFVRPSTLKKQLLARIKTHQQKKNTILTSSQTNRVDDGAKDGNIDRDRDRDIYNKLGSSSASSSITTSNNDNQSRIPPISQTANINESFSQSLDYLKSLAANARDFRHQRKQKNKTHKAKTNLSINVAPASVVTSPEVMQPPIQSSALITNSAEMTQPNHLTQQFTTQEHSTTPSPQVFLGTFPNTRGDEAILPTAQNMYMPSVSNIQDASVLPGHHNIPIQSASVLTLNTEPKWGCLKMGNKPTFRTFHNKTSKVHTSIDFPDGNNIRNISTNETSNHPVESILGKDSASSGENTVINKDTNINNEEDTSATSNDRSETISTTELLYGTRQQRLDDYRKEQLKADKEQVEPVLKIKQTKQRLITKRYKLGKYKNKDGEVIGVLIKNAQTQRNVENKRNEMRRLPLDTIVSRLHKKRLLKVGSSAPPDVLREMYESAVLAGDIENEGNDIALHNFLAGADK
jgi:hypothetical protein